MRRSLHFELQFCLLSFTLSSIIIIALISFFSIKKKSEIDALMFKMNAIQVLCLKDFKLHNDFINQESINSRFFTTGESQLLKQNEINDDKINALIDEVYNDELTQKSNYVSQLSFIKQLYKSYENNFDSIRQLILRRGFKDWGLEGKMRDNAHRLEKFPEVDKITILQLRRREKDFIIRLDTSYIAQVHVWANHIIDSARNHKTELRDSILLCASQYIVYFDSLVYCELLLGLKNQTGLKQMVDNTSELLDLKIKKMVQSFEIQQKELYEKVSFLYVLDILSFVILSIFISFRIARNISKPFIQLSNHINKFVVSEFQLQEKLAITNVNIEVQTLNSNFSKMQSEIIEYLNYFKKKVDERTKEINQQMEEIQLQRDLIQIQKAVVEQHNRNITDSIKYAQRIQQAMLPDEEMLKIQVPNCFIMNKAKDIVSGDFYFIDLIQDELLFVAADGTGHGVPGAFMSVLGLNNIMRVVYGQGKTNPVEVLTALNGLLIQALRKKRNKYYLSDSMDIAYCKVNIKTRKLQFAGAFRPCFIVRKNVLIELEANRVTIGSDPSKEIEIKSQTVDLEPGDCVYIFTDGYCDQFGGTDRKKFKKKAFIDLLIGISHHPAAQQKQLLEQTFEAWKKHEPQTDDVLVMGFVIG